MSVAALTDTATYALRLGDDALVLSQQLGLWISRAPELEEELALANIALDLLGQARVLLSSAGDEDDLAYHRPASEFLNLLLVEQQNGDFAHTMVRQLFFSTFQLARYQELTGSTDETLAGVAGRGVKEVSYHREHAAQWVIRLGDGTVESRERTARAVKGLWPYTAEMFERDEIDRSVGVDPGELRQPWLSYVESVLDEATLSLPKNGRASRRGGRYGDHSPKLEQLLQQMQALPRAHPGSSW